MLSDNVKIYSEDSVEWSKNIDVKYNPFLSRSFLNTKGITNEKRCVLVFNKYNEYLEEWENIIIPFTYWGEEELKTPEQALLFFKNCAKFLYELSEDFKVDSQDFRNYTQSLKFNKKYSLGAQVYCLNNIDYLEADCYVFYSCYKLLDYMVNSTDEDFKVFEDKDDLLNFIHNAETINKKL